jgi:hypothetical protein
MDPPAYYTRNAYPQAHFLFDFPYRGVSWIFSGLDLASNECPRRPAIIAPGH